MASQDVDPTNLRHIFTKLSYEPHETRHNFCALGIISRSLPKWQCKTSNWHVFVGGVFEKESFDVMLQQHVYFFKSKDRRMTLTFSVVTSVFATPLMMYSSNYFDCVYRKTLIIWEISMKALFTLKFYAIESSLTSIFQYSAS